MMAGMDTPEKRRWYYPTPGWLVLGSMAVTGLLFASEKWGWFPFNGHKGYTVLAAAAGVGVVLVVMLLWWLVALVFRWRFQFGIRTLLVLTVVVALPFSWLSMEMKTAKGQKAVVEAIEQLGGGVDFDWEYDKNFVHLPSALPHDPVWLRSWLGDDFFAEVVIVRLGFTQVTNEGLAYIAGLTRLEALLLEGTQVTNDGLAHIGKLTQLRELSLNRTQVTDDGLTHIGGLTRLQYLYLNDTQVTDEGLEQIVGLTQLQGLCSATHRLRTRGWQISLGCPNSKSCGSTA